MSNLGTYLHLDDLRPAIRFRRRYEDPVETVWATFVDPDESRYWFPSTLLIEERRGGVVRFSEDPNTPDGAGEVLVYEPPHRIEFTWGGDEVRFNLEPDGDGCALTLTNVLATTDTAARNAAGWTVCLLELDKYLAGDAACGPHGDSAADFEPIYQEYVQAGMPSGAPIPSRK